MKIARVYLRVSTKGQDLTRQEAIIENAREKGFYVAAVYREKASGNQRDRPELLRMISELQPGEVVIAENIDRITRLPLAEAENLVASIREKGAKLAIPGIVDMSELAATADGVTKIVIEATQDMLLKLALQISHNDFQERRNRIAQGVAITKEKGMYKGRKPDLQLHKDIVALRSSGVSITRTAELTGCCIAQVKRVWANHKAS
jgi:DNA invertase Pin-like site-specific DNA recombinase